MSSTPIPSASFGQFARVRSLPVSGEDLRPGMIVRKPDENVPHKIGDYTGQCFKGRHFGNGCYDRISPWAQIMNPTT